MKHPSRQHTSSNVGLNLDHRPQRSSNKVGSTFRVYPARPLLCNGECVSSLTKLIIDNYIGRHCPTCIGPSDDLTF